MFCNAYPNGGVRRYRNVDEPRSRQRQKPEHVPTGRLADLVARAERLRADSERHLSALHPHVDGADGADPDA